MTGDADRPDDAAAPAPRSRRFAFACVALLLAVCAALCAGEILARVFVGEQELFTKPERWEPHPLLGRILKANHAFERDGVPYATNALHLRDRDYAPEPPDGVRRVLVVGDSFVHGIGPLETIFPKVVERRLAPDVEVMAVGLPGYGTIQQNIYLAEYLRDVRFDLLVLAFCVGNDVRENERFMKREHLADRSRRGDRKRRRDEEDGSWLDRSKLYEVYRAQMREMRRENEELFLEVVDTRTDLAEPAYYADGTPGAEALARTRDEIARMSDFARERGAPTVVLFLPEEYQVVDALWETCATRKGWKDGDAERFLVQEKVTEAVGSLGRDDLTVVDPIDEFASPPAEGFYIPRDTHFNAAGNAAMARALERIVADALLDGTSKPPR